MMEITDQEFLSELKACGFLDVCASEYEKLTQASKRSQENDERLVAKCRKLKATKASLSVKLNVALELTTDDPSHLSVLEEDVKVAWQENKEAREKLEASEEMIEELQRAISELSHQPAQEIDLSDLFETKDELTQKRNDLLNRRMSVTQIIEKATSDQQELEVLQEEALEEISKLQMDVQARCAEVSNATLRKECAEKQLEELLVAEDTELEEVKELSANCKLAEEKQRKLEENLRLCKAVTEEVTQKLEEQEAKNEELRLKNEMISDTVEDQLLKIQQMKSVFTTSQDEVKILNQKTCECMQRKEDGQKRLDKMVDQKMQMEEQRGMLRAQKDSLEQEIELHQKQAKIDDATIKELMRIKYMRSKELLNATDAVMEQREDVMLHEQTKNSLQREINHFSSEARKQQQLIDQQRKKRKPWEKETIFTEKKVIDVTEEAQNRELEIHQCRMNVADVQDEEKRMQHLYEAAKCDEIVFSNQLRELQDELIKMKGLISMMQSEEHQLKEKLHEDEMATEKVTQELIRVEDQCKRHKVAQHDLENKIQERKRIIDKQGAMERKLFQETCEIDTQIFRVSRQQNQAVHKRSLLARKLVERRKEAESLCKKVKVQQNVVNERDAEYHRTVKKISMLKMEIKNLAQEKRTANEEVPMIENLRHAVICSQKELVKQQIRYKALEADIRIPKNVHRWRQLKLSEPETYHLIQKLHFLQQCKRTQEREAEESENLFQLRQKSYMQRKHVLDRKPGLEVAEQLRISDQILSGKRQELKKLRDEGTACRTQNKEFKNKINMLDRELRKVQGKCSEKTRREVQSSLGKEQEELTSSQMVESVQDTSSLCLPNISDAPQSQRM